MEIVENVLVVGDKRVVTDLFYPTASTNGGLPRVRTIIAPGGAKSGHTVGQRLCAFQAAGITADNFDAGLATSAGSYNMAGYCARQTHLISKVYEELSWLNPKVMSSALHGDLLGLQYLERYLREVLDTETLRTCRMDLTIGVSDLKANPILHKLKEAEDIFDVLFASSALFPIVSGRVINGTYCIDGGFTRRSLAARWAHQLFREIPRGREIDVLFLANRPHPEHMNRFEEFVFLAVARVMLLNYPELFRGLQTIGPKLRMVSAVFERKHPRIRMCALFPMYDENIYPNEWRRFILRARGELTRRRTECFLAALKPACEV